MYSIFWWGWVVKTEHMKLSQLSSSSENPMKSRWYTRVEEASNFESNGCINLDYASDDHSFQWVPDVLTSQKSLYGIMFSQPFGTCSPLISKMGIRTTKSLDSRTSSARRWASRRSLDCEQSLIFLCKVTARETQACERWSREAR